MDTSFFSALRVVAMVIGVDGRFHPAERHWLFRLLKRYGIPKEEIKTLKRDFSNSDSLEKTILQIKLEDRERLKEWIEQVIHLDGEFHEEERVLQNRIHKLLRTDLASSDAYTELARSLLEHDKKLEFWRELNDIGLRLKRPIPYWKRVWFWMLWW